MPLQPSDQAPAFCAQLSGGKTVCLADYRGHRLVLIFVRHLACLPCQEHLLEVQDSLPTISEQGAQVLVVSFDTVEQLEGYRTRLKLTFPVAADPERVAYEAYGLTQGSLLHIWHPKTLWRYVVLRLKGRKLQRPKKGDDLSQLGGDFVVNARGEVVFAHYSSRPDDRPEVAAIMDAVSTHSR